jgi:hypothetical protein
VALVTIEFQKIVAKNFEFKIQKETQEAAVIHKAATLGSYTYI